MSVLIKGMKMPKNCKRCPLRYTNTGYTFCELTGENLAIETDKRDDACPLVEAPDKHGELIERKAVIDICGEKQGTANSIGEMRGISRVWKAVKKLPTIIEAEGSEE